MKLTREDFETGWTEVAMGLSSHEVDRLIQMLQLIKQDPNQHFHCSSNHEDDSRIAGVDFYIKQATDSDNATIVGPAIEPNR